MSGGFTVADANALRKFGDFIEIFSCFFRHSESAFADSGFHILGSVAGERDFKIVDQRRAVHGDSGDEAAFHQIDQDGAKADLDDVAADTPQNRFVLLPRNVNRAEEIAKILRRKNVGQ